MAAGSGPPHPILSLRGTEGSNPAPSGGESAANLISSIRAIHELGLPGDVGKWGNGSHLASGLAPQPSAPTPQAMQQLACRDNPYCELKPLIAPVGLEMPHARGVRSPYEETGATVAAFARPVRLRPVDRRSTPCLSPIAPRTSSLAMQTQRRRLRRTRPERSAWPEPEPTSSGLWQPREPMLPDDRDFGPAMARLTQRQRIFVDVCSAASSRLRLDGQEALPPAAVEELRW